MLDPEIIMKMLSVSPAFALLFWLLLQARADVKEERTRNQNMVDTILKITEARVADANTRGNK